MTKLHEIVRGVEEKESPKGKDCNCMAHSYDECGCEADWTDNDGYNALASAEVVVSQEKLWQYLWRETSITSQKDAKDIAKAIATAIEQGGIIRVKEDK